MTVMGGGWGGFFLKYYLFKNTISWDVRTGGIYNLLMTVMGVGWGGFFLNFIFIKMIV